MCFLLSLLIYLLFKFFVVQIITHTYKYLLLLTSLCKKLSKNLHFSFSLSSSPRRRVWIFDVTSKVQRHITQLFCYCSGSHHCFSETKLTQVVKLLFYTTIHIAADIAFSRHTENQAQTHLVQDNFF